MVFYFGFIICVLGTISVTYKTFNNRNILSPQMFLFAGILLYLFLPAVINKYAYIYDDKFNVTLLFGAIGCCIAAAMFPYNIMDKNEEEIAIPKLSLFRVIAYLYALCLLYEIINTIVAYGSISAVFSANRLSSYLGDNILNSSPIRTLFFEGMKICFYFYIDMRYSDNKKVEALILFSVPMIHHRFTAVTRYDFIAMACALVMYIIDKQLYTRISQNEKLYKKKRINLLKILVIGIIGMYFALIFMRVANLTRHGITDWSTIDLSISNMFKTLFSTDSQYYEYFHALYNAVETGAMEYEYGLAWIIYPIINFIPRAIWPGKPYTSFSVRATEAVYWSYTSGNPVVTFSIFGEGFAQLGYIGCLICPIIFLACRWFNFKQAKQMKYNQLYILIVMFSLLTYMRAEAPIFYALVDGIWLWLITSFCRYGRFIIKIRRKKCGKKK